MVVVEVFVELMTAPEASVIESRLATLFPLCEGSPETVLEFDRRRSFVGVYQCGISLRRTQN